MPVETESRAIPVMRPSLPVLGDLEPYLREIDRNRWYANFGPLVRELERRLTLALGGGEDTVATANNATVALMAALIALDAPPGAPVAVPSWTFCASAHAVLLAGLTPYPVDVDERTWALTPDALREVIARDRIAFAAAMPVAPFGAPLDQGEWLRFRDETGVPVVVDAAAAFDTWRAGEIPAVVSLHATKSLGAGEGGLIVCSDPEVLARARRVLNFGFGDSNVAECRATNGKMTEYVAAVALAALDRWAESRADWQRAAGLYGGLANLGDVLTQPGFGREWVGSALVVRLPGRDRRAVAAALSAQGIQTRPWWPLALPDHPAFAACPGGDAAVGRRLAQECLGLPYYRDIAAAEVARVLAALEESLA